MKTKNLMTGCLLIALSFISASLLGISSPNYGILWFTPLTSGGGGHSTSPLYQVDFTIGQNIARETIQSPNYKAGLGYWHGLSDYIVYLPLILK